MNSNDKQCILFLTNTSQTLLVRAENIVLNKIIC